MVRTASEKSKLYNVSNDFFNLAWKFNNLNSTAKVMLLSESKSNNVPFITVNEVPETKQSDLISLIADEIKPSENIVEPSASERNRFAAHRLGSVTYKPEAKTINAPPPDLEPNSKTPATVSSLIDRVERLKYEDYRTLSADDTGGNLPSPTAPQEFINPITPRGEDSILTTPASPTVAVRKKTPLPPPIISCRDTKVNHNLIKTGATIGGVVLAGLLINALWRISQPEVAVKPTTQQSKSKTPKVAVDKISEEGLEESQPAATDISSYLAELEIVNRLSAEKSDEDEMANQRKDSTGGDLPSFEDKPAIQPQADAKSKVKVRQISSGSAFNTSQSINYPNKQAVFSTQPKEDPTLLYDSSAPKITSGTYSHSFFPVEVSYLKQDSMFESHLVDLPAEDFYTPQDTTTIQSPLNPPTKSPDQVEEATIQTTPNEIAPESYYNVSQPIELDQPVPELEQIAPPPTDTSTELPDTTPVPAQDAQTTSTVDEIQPSTQIIINTVEEIFLNQDDVDIEFREPGKDDVEGENLGPKTQTGDINKDEQATIQTIDRQLNSTEQSVEQLERSANAVRLDSTALKIMNEQISNLKLEVARIQDKISSASKTQNAANPQQQPKNSSSSLQSEVENLYRDAKVLYEPSDVSFTKISN